MRILMLGAVLALILAAGPATALNKGGLAAPAAADRHAAHLTFAGGKGKGGAGQGHGSFLPPGQVKKWARGQYLPKTIVWTPAPALVIAKLKPVPPGHRYVVVDGEILLIALATGLILDVFDVI
ncbi:MAG TPA: hypothetical protein VED46_18090 [Alphaproteobacteria bacterium]|nr:hypothetical protein [Alphaproteobacteria bacterium]